MLRKPDPLTKKVRSSSAAAGGDPSSTRFLHELETLSKALALAPNPRRLSLPTLNPNPKPPPERKPSSLWSWKNPLRALSHLRHPRRFDCTFSLLVHSIESLPPPLADQTLVVHWRRDSDPSGARTRPAKAFHGSAEFEETLACRCSVYGTGGRSGNARYEPRHFVIYVTLAGGSGFDLGKHHVGLTRILPVAIEELEGDRTSGEWSTSFRLAGRARGAMLNVSFGYSVVASGDRKREDMRRAESVKGVSFDVQERPRPQPQRVAAKPQVEGSCVLREVMKAEYEVFDEMRHSPELKCCATQETVGRGNEEIDGDEPEFTVIE